MVERIPDITFTGTGDSSGYLTGVSNVGVYPGATGYLRKSDNTANQFVQVTDVVGATKVGLKFLPEGMDDVKLRNGVVKFPNYGHTDLTAYGAGSILQLPAQTAPVNQDGTRLPTIYE